MTKNKLKNELLNYLDSFGKSRKNGDKIKNSLIKEKLKNICGKTGKYNVPDTLFLHRTNRKSRVLISWKTIRKNCLTLEKLKGFKNGVVVEFINEDFFLDLDEPDFKNESMYETFNKLKYTLIGSNEIVSAIISFKNEDSNPSSEIPKICYERFIKEKSQINYKGKTISISKNNIKQYYVKRSSSCSNNNKGISFGNDKWDGFLFLSIKGGNQNSIESHANIKKTEAKNYYLFNPACEYADEDVSLDIDLVMSYFALNSVNKQKLDKEGLDKYCELYNRLEKTLEESIYFRGSSEETNLLNYCKNHYCLKFIPGRLCDPIQVSEINIEDFDISSKENPNCIDLTHNEAISNNKFYYDESRGSILSPARPTNLFWSKHLSNMMQQDKLLDDFFEFERNNVQKREQFLSGK